MADSFEEVVTSVWRQILVQNAKIVELDGKRYFVMDRKRLIWFALRDRGVAAAREIEAARRKRLGT